MSRMESNGSDFRQIVRERGESAADAVDRLQGQSVRWTVIAVGCGGLATLLSGLAATGVQARVLASAAALFTAVSVFTSELHRRRIEGRLRALEVFAAVMEELGALMDERRIPAEEAVQRFGAALRECPAIPRCRLPFEAAHGSIDSPGDGAHLPEHFVASGTAREVGPEVHLWLTIRIGDSIWPKNSRIEVRGGRWEQPVHHTNPGEFGLTLWAATAEADRELQRWLDRGTRLRRYAGMPPLPGMRELDHVGGLRGGVRDASRGKRVRRRLAVLISGDERFAHHP